MNEYNEEIDVFWQALLMSVGQRNITCAEEFDLMNDWMSGNDHRYPKLF